MGCLFVAMFLLLLVLVLLRCLLIVLVSVGWGLIWCFDMPVGRLQLIGLV